MSSVVDQHLREIFDKLTDVFSSLTDETNRGEEDELQMRCRRSMYAEIGDRFIYTEFAVGENILILQITKKM